MQVEAGGRCVAQPTFGRARYHGFACVRHMYDKVLMCVPCNRTHTHVARVLVTFYDCPFRCIICGYSQLVMRVCVCDVCVGQPQHDTYSLVIVRRCVCMLYSDEITNYLIALVDH